jgi:hypothetical protein
MDEAGRLLAQMEFTYADADPAACAELARRIAVAGRTEEDFLYYSDLVDGVIFNLPNVASGRPYQIREWNDLDRAIIGSFLGRIAADSYQLGQFLANALVIGKEANQPGDGFFTLARVVRDGSGFRRAAKGAAGGLVSASVWQFLCVSGKTLTCYSLSKEQQ